MNIKILVEPTCFIFNIIENNNADNQGELARFDEFFANLRELSEKLQKQNLSIAISKDLYELFKDSFPVSAYDMHKYPKAKIISQTLRQILQRLFKRPYHNFGDHQLESDFSDNSVDKANELYDTEVYCSFRDLAGLILIDKLPNAILNSQENSVFLSNEAVIIDKDNNAQKLVQITAKVDELVNFKCIKYTRNISKLFKYSLEENNDIECAGTGTHDSMWSNKIRKLTDVPDPERTLLKLLIQTNLVKKITFLDFDNGNSSSTEIPRIIIYNIDSKPHSDILYCTLNGKGIKKNCQNICIDFVSGAGQLLAELLDNEITELKLQDLLKRKT